MKVLICRSAEWKLTRSLPSNETLSVGQCSGGQYMVRDDRCLLYARNILVCFTSLISVYKTYESMFSAEHLVSMTTFLQRVTKSST